MPSSLPTSVELLAPAGNWDCLRAAVANGADAVYFGLPRFNARLKADNFSEEELPEVTAFCHRRGVRAYAAFNTLVFTAELDDAEAYLRLLNEARVDALIVQDIGLVRLARAVAPEMPLHASTQMTITSPEGIVFARELGVERVVLAREVSLREMERFDPAGMPLEVFVHGALCVAYSGQCLTSESLGQRSANRGECAQACRMPYELVVDGAVRDLGDRRYLLSPQDLAAVDEIPALLERGVTSFKIEGRLKSPEYVAGVCQVYRRAIDAALEHRPHAATAEDRYQLEMTFSRGLFTGWMHGVDHQRLAPARYGKKRGPLAGRVAAVGVDFVDLDADPHLAPGDGIVFDTGGDTNAEQGGRIYSVRGRRIAFGRDHIDFSRVHEGDRVWKTDDPALEKRLRQSFAGRIEARGRAAVDLRVSGRPGEPLVIEVGQTRVESSIPLQEARTAPLTTEALRRHLGRLAETAFELSELRNDLQGGAILPIGELNRLRRELVYRLEAIQNAPRRSTDVHWRELLKPRSTQHDEAPSRLSVLCRTSDHIAAALTAGADAIHVDFEDIRRYGEAVSQVRESGAVAKVYLATPRIQKAGEHGFFKLIGKAAPDGVLIRNLGAIDYFLHSPSPPLEMIGDFSLNVANPLSADYFILKGLSRVTISYDLTSEQVLDLLAAAPHVAFELTIHQHMPMFHMEHCVFAAFMSKGSTFLDCGRPCEKHRVHLRDRVGMEHPLRADVGCRNTLFSAVQQTGARFFTALHDAGLRHFRVELLEENENEARKTVEAYRALLSGERDGGQLWRDLNARSQLGVTGGTLTPSISNPFHDTR